jgi:putative ATPase
VLAASRASTTTSLVETGRCRSRGGSKSLRYGEDEHYDVISAFIKSIRGSDVDAGLYWLARMLEAGEDARFIARRLVILASEDIGMADSTSLLIANAAAHAVEFVGLPEAQLNLRSRGGASRDGAEVESVLPRVVARARGGQAHPRRRSRARASARRALQGAATLGHGKGYVYPHDDPAGWVAQNYRPVEVADDVYYEPSDHGYEAVIAERLGARTSGRAGNDERD